MTPLTQLVTDVVAAFLAKGAPTLPEGKRDEVLATLTGLLAGPRLGGYLAALRDEAQKQGGVLGEQGSVEWPWEAILAHGLGVLSDPLLALLAVSDATLLTLREALADEQDEGNLAPCWCASFIAEAERALQEDGLAGVWEKKVAERFHEKRDAP